MGWGDGVVGNSLISESDLKMNLFKKIGISVLGYSSHF